MRILKKDLANINNILLSMSVSYSTVVRLTYKESRTEEENASMQLNMDWYDSCLSQLNAFGLCSNISSYRKAV